MGCHCSGSKLKPQQVKKLLEESAEDLGKSGKDSNYGFGLVNPVKALELLAKGVPETSSELRIKSIHINPYYITVGTTATLTLNVSNNEQPLGYGWKVTGGSIVGQGKTVQWQVPTQAGKYQIIAGVNNRKIKAYGMTSIIVY